MYISEIKMTNFRSLGTERPLAMTFTPGVNFLVGENNMGKTTVLHAIQFVFDKKKPFGTEQDWVTKGKEREGVSVEMTLSDVGGAVDGNPSLRRLKPYIVDESIVIKRSSLADDFENPEERALTYFCRKSDGTFEPQSITMPKAVQGLLVPVTFYGDIEKGDYQNFGSTAMLGALLADATKGIDDNEAWQEFIRAHKRAFGTDGIGSMIDPIRDEIQECVREQYGEAELEFSFDALGASSFIKNGSLLVSDNGVLSDVSTKGTGLQRSVALALIRVYAKRSLGVGDDHPPVFLLDEPETFLHPKAQDNLMEAVNDIGKACQVFITTHSPYLLRSFDPNKGHSLLVFTRESPGKAATIDGSQSAKLGAFSRGGSLGPSWGAINWYAFGMPSIDFHIELFGKLQEIVDNVNIQRNTNSSRKKVGKIDAVDNWLADDCPSLTGITVHAPNPKTQHNAKGSNRTFVVYIRNYIDHPGSLRNPVPGKSREAPGMDEIGESIGLMLRIIEACKAKGIGKPIAMP